MAKAIHNKMARQNGLAPTFRNGVAVEIQHSTAFCRHSATRHAVRHKRPLAAATRYVRLLTMNGRLRLVSIPGYQGGAREKRYVRNK